MNFLKEVIKSLSKEEVKNYKLITSRSHAKKERKDTQLFDLYRQASEHTSDEELVRKLFGGKENKNAFYRLKNKILEDLDKSLFFLHTNKYPKTHVYQLRELARHFENKNYLRLAYFYLDKAKKQAQKINDYESLSLIYRQLISLSQGYMEIDPEPFIEAKKDCDRKLAKIDELDELIAIIKYRIHKSYNLAGRSRGILEMLQKTIDEFSNDPDLLKNRNNQLKLYDAVSSIMIQKQDYGNLASYVEQTFTQFENNGWFNKQNHETKLKMLAYMINANYKLGEYQKSLSWANALKGEMERYKWQYYNKYLIFYYNSLLINYAKLDPHKALELVDFIKTKEEIINWEDYPVLTLLNPAVLYHQIGKVNKALDSLNQFFLHQVFEELDKGFQFKTRLVELMMYYDADEVDILDYKLDQFRKNFQEELNADGFEKEQKFLVLFERLIERELSTDKDQDLENDTQSFIKEYENEEKSDDLIPYDEWLARNLFIK